MIGKVVTGCVAILPYHTATQDRGSECRDFGFISRIVTALDNIIPKFKIGQNPFNKNVIVVPHNKITVLSIYTVKLSLNLVVVVMSPVQHDIILIIDEAEALFPSTQAQIGFILVRVWTLKSHREGHVNNRLTNIFSGFLLSLGLYKGTPDNIIK